jgi:radical SAM protein with 4Fe4S-binding SPASM domain
MSHLRIFLNKAMNKINRPNHTPKRFMNSSLVFVSRILRSSRVFGFPEHIIIEPTNVCDLRCPLCPTGSGAMKRKRGFLSLENFKKIVDEIAPCAYYLTLAGYGEPFLNKDIIEMIAYAKKRQLIVNVATNAQHIGSVAVDGVINAGLDRLVVSLDGISQPSYEKYRIGGDLSKVISAIKALVDQKRKSGKMLPYIAAQFLITKYNEHEIEGIKDLASQLSTDVLIFKKACDMNSFPKDIRQMAGYLPDNIAYRAYRVNDGVVSWNTDKKDINFCGMAWNYPAIAWDGSLFPCCISYDGLVMGNVLETGFRKAWNGKKFMEFRKKLRENKKSIRECSDCGANFCSDIID